MPTNLEGKEFYTDREWIIWDHEDLKNMRRMVKKNPDQPVYAYDGGFYGNARFKSLIKQLADALQRSKFWFFK